MNGKKDLMVKKIWALENEVSIMLFEDKTDAEKMMIKLGATPASGFTIHSLHLWPAGSMGE